MLFQRFLKRIKYNKLLFFFYSTLRFLYKIIIIFFKKIDLKVIGIFLRIKSYLYNTRIETSFLFIKYYFIFLMQKINDLIYLNCPNLSKLLKDVFFIYKSNKEFILYSIRMYLYSVIFLYIITFSFLTVALFTGNQTFVPIAK